MRKSTIKRLFPLAAFATLFVVAGCSQPADDDASSGGTTAPAATAAPTAATTSTATAAESTKVTITVTSPGVAELAFPVNPDGKRQTMSDVQTTGPWTQTYNGQRIQTTQQGSTVTLTLLGPHPVIPFLQAPTGAGVSLKYGDTTQAVSLKGNPYGWHQVTLGTAAPASAATGGK